MEIKEIYKELASTLDAYQSCKKSLNTWQEKHAKRLEELLDKLPHGSGIDGSYYLNWDADPNKYIEFSCQFHLMNDNGYYDGWTDFTVRVYPHLFLDVRLVISGKFPGKYQDVKESLYDVYQ